LEAWTPAMESQNPKIKIIQLSDDDTHLSRMEMSACIYARHSCEGNSPLSCDEQIERIKYRIQSGQLRSRRFPNAKITIDNRWVLKDEAKTGRTTGRDGYELGISGVKSKAFDLFLTDDISRLTRELGETLDLYDALVFQDVEGISVSDNTSTLDPNSRDLFIFKGYANEAQSKATSRHTMRGLEVRCLKGFSTGHNPYGYYSVATKTLFMKGHEKPSWFEIKIDYEKSQIVIRIWKEFADGLGCRAIATRLNGDQVPPPGKNKRAGTRWSEKAVWNILNQPKYLGDWSYRQTQVKKNPEGKRMEQMSRPKKEWLVLQRDDLRIIPTDIADKVKTRKDQMRREREEALTTEQKIFSRTNRLPSHIFVGTLKCAICDGNMFIASGKNGGYLGCFNNKRETGHNRCENKAMVLMVDVETTLIGVLKEKLGDPATYETIAKKYNEIVGRKKGAVPKELDLVEEELSRCETAIGNFTAFIAQGNLSDTIAHALKSEEAKRSHLKTRQGYLKGQLEDKVYITPTVIKRRLESLNDILAKHMSDANRIMRRVFPDKVTMHPPCEGRKNYALSGAVNLYSLVKFDSVEVSVPTVQLSELNMLNFNADVKKGTSLRSHLVTE